MFFQLSEIRKQQALTQNLEQSKQKTHEILIESYSFNQKVQKPLRERFGSILNQSALLLHNLREIQESVKHKCLLPSIFNDRELNKLIFNRGNLPQWFQHVFQKQYEKQKINIEIIANKFYKLHGLSQKFLQLQKEHQNLQTLYIRYESINDKQLQKLDIVEEMNSFQSLYKSCKQIYKNFLFFITKKVLQFLQKTIESTLVYSNQLKKVKSSQNLHFTPTVNNPLIPNIYLQKRDFNDTTILKNKNLKNVNKILDYYPESINQTKGKLQKNSTVESLRQREKQNNQFFFRKALVKEKFNQTFQTEQIKPYRSQHTNRYQSPISLSKLRQLQTSRDSSIKKERNFYQQSLAFKDPLTIRNAKSIDQSQLYSKSYRSPTKNYQAKALQRSGIQKVQNQCYHHCPHHDKILNNHCSKHCNKLCSHEKHYLKDYGLDLTKMNRQFYQSRQKVKQQQLKTYRSTDLNRSTRQYLSPQFKESNYVSKMKKKEDENVSYLLGSDEKNKSISQNKQMSNNRYKSVYSPLRQNLNYSTHQKIENNLKLSYIQQRHPSPLQHIRHQPLTFRSQYY